MSRLNSGLPQADYYAIAQTSPFIEKIDTSKLFDLSYTDFERSPLDQFIKNTNALNLVWLSQTVSPELASIVLLGYISAVESYIRALIRGLINIDETCKIIVEAHQISFVAAMHHDKRILPEALLEEVSFASPDSIKKALTKFVGITNCYDGADDLFNEFEKISQLRHCCTHRFGKLGAKNAVALGFSTHRDCLEKPMHLSKNDLEKTIELVRNFVKTLNNLVFRQVIERTAVGGKIKLKDSSVDAIILPWSWATQRDKKIFSKYYDLFATTTDSVKSPDQIILYKRFRDAFNKTKDGSLKNQKRPFHLNSKK